MDVHVINLEQTHDRLVSFRANNQHLHNIVRFAAVDGGKISGQQLSALGIFGADAPTYTHGAIGCALSHLLLWKQAMEQAGPFTVAEDDAIFNRGFEQEAEALLRSLPPDWDIVLLGWNFDSILLFDFLPGVSPCLSAFSEAELRAYIKEFQQAAVKPQAYRLQRAFGTLAYSVSPNGAMKLVKHCVPIRKMEVFCPGIKRPVPNFGIDVMMNALYPEINAYVAFPPLAVSPNDKTVSTANLVQEAKPQEALKLLDTAIGQGETAELWNDWATMQCARGNVALAEQGYHRALHVDGSARQPGVNLGLLLLAQGRIEEAAPLFEQYKTTLTDQERHATLELVKRFRAQLALKKDHGQNTTTTEGGPRSEARIVTRGDMSVGSYTRSFYERIRQGSIRSARTVLPIVLALTNPRSVIDVGCGEGCWLAVLRELGLTEILGVDGPWVDRRTLLIPQDQFRTVDLTGPFRIERSFDLALSLEVAEHLPLHCAPDFVESLTRMAPVVFFSAAIPFQGGDHHINEQWPDYWAGLFKCHDYLPIDCVRGKIWENSDVEWWYAQNALVFASSAVIQTAPALRREYERTNPRQLCMVHPKLHLGLAGRARVLTVPSIGSSFERMTLESK